MQYQDILEQDITDLDNLYLLIGDEEYLMKEFIDQFITEFVEEEFKDFNLDTINDSNDGFLTKLSNSVNQLPFMVDRRITILNGERLFTNRFNKDETEDLKELLNDFAETSILLVKTTNQPDKRRKLYKAFKESGQILDFENLKYKALDEWIETRANELGNKIDSKAVKLLEKMFNNNLQRLDSELQKISTFLGSKEIMTFKKVRQIISKDRLLKENIIFDFVDAIGEQNNEQALHLLNQMINNGQSEIGLLMMIARQVRLILQCKELYQQGKKPQQIANRLNQHPYPIKKCIKQSKNFSISELEDILEQLLESNINLVTGEDKELELELLILKLGQIVNSN
ncbi:DNA polymerase III subunit delta [Acetohalobium arabaticum]|uniref:DNA polymerase III subunit delta n=1 Tax=Acetohalobium arabaticum (strain ATCC 49924 / DSM 5501 / Z-7288) TaxID=574087 RepID=D9QV78_ACEAZ|nr:DNA polymerase III subunit delta [Acetohalobium arabaticum]ADL12137.1 DNA polymerase III, delta subunit [Acetohalobium arabaticum DSM 5501]